MILEPAGARPCSTSPGRSSGAATGTRSRRSSPTASPTTACSSARAACRPGAPPDGYGRLVAIAHAAGVPAVVDANGATLGGALEAGPDVVTPEPRRGRGRCCTATATRRSRPPRRAAARAAGRRGAARARRARRPSSPPPRRARRSRRPTAAAWVAAPQRDRRATRSGRATCWPSALAAALERGEPVVAALRAGVTAAAAAVESPTAGVLDRARMRELLAATAIEPG